MLIVTMSLLHEYFAKHLAEFGKKIYSVTRNFCQQRTESTDVKLTHSNGRNYLHKFKISGTVAAENWSHTSLYWISQGRRDIIDISKVLHVQGELWY